ncbi:hypothetical protein PIB30_069624 [Stylosanthes scabra]|uniref:Uncharacterized protein n=1 Tax=Stylosanthes scabra TaxID=79078 RepID=A0ABU6XL34_9FABA|nr:hypothetical protein [Stylosanthes scabra]
MLYACGAIVQGKAWSFNPQGIDTHFTVVLLDTIRYTCRDLGLQNTASNSHHTDECPQLQEDNIVASTHNFYDATIISPYNRQYYTQGGRDSQPASWIPPQQPEAQPRQPYTYSQP